MPADDGAGRTWTGAFAQEPFADTAAAGWIQGALGVGFEAPGQQDPVSPVVYWNFDNGANPGVALDAAGGNHSGTLIGSSYTPEAGGRTGTSGDRALQVGGGGRMEVADAATGLFDAATTADALTVSFWIYGGVTQPGSGSVFWFQEFANGSGARAAQAHVPWSDSIIYWDTGNGGDCCSGSARMFKAEPDPTKWKGRWNHYAFIKDGARKEIWQNGALWHEAINNYPLTTLRQLTVGSAPGGTLPYEGRIDDFAVWSRALTSDQIQVLAGGARRWRSRASPTTSAQTCGT